MKVKCISATISIENSSNAIIEWANNSEMEITIGKTYAVLAISKYFDTIFYYIIGDESDSYPLAFPSNLFQIIDHNISKYWTTSLNEVRDPQDLEIGNGEIISFKEWTTKGDEFYEKLLDEEKKEVKLFDMYRDRILTEI